MFPTPTHLAVKKKKNGAYSLLAENEVNSTIFKILRHKRIWMPCISYCLETTVEPVLSSTVLSGHPVLSSRLSKSWICVPFISYLHLYWAVMVTIEWVPKACLYCPPLVFNGHLRGTTQIKPRIIFEVKLNPCFSPEINVGSIFSKFLYISGHFYITPLLWNLY